MLPETDDAAARQIAARVSERLTRDVENPRITVSFGVGLFPRDGNSAEAILSGADRALYAMKARSQRALPHPRQARTFSDAPPLTSVAPMPQSARVTVAGIVLLGALIPAACMVFDALGPTGPRGVTFIHTGVTDLRVGELTPVEVTVLAQGVPLPQPRLRVEISPDSTRVTLNVAGDSLIPCQSGQASLLVRLLHSSAAGTAMPDTSIALRVTGGGPSDARCPP